MTADKIRIIILPKPLSEPITGGEIYNKRLFEFLNQRYASVYGLRERAKNSRTQTPLQYLVFALSCFMVNIKYVLQFTKLVRDNQKTILIEDLYNIADFFIFNAFVRLSPKHVQIVPLIHHLMFPQYHGLVSKFTYILEKQAVANSNLIIVTSEETKMEVSCLHNAKKNIIVATPGLDFPANEDTAINGLEKSHVDIVSVGTITRRKDYETLLRSISELKTRKLNQPFRVTIVGDKYKEEDYALEMEEAADTMQISDIVKFVGRVDNKELCSILERSDIYVCTSTHEGFGMAIAEAMRFQLPIVASNAGAIPLLVHDGVNGLLFRPKDPSNLSEKLSILLKSNITRAQMGRNGYALSLSFDWNKSFEKIERALNNLVDEKV